MENIIKELYEFITERHLADREIMLEEVDRMDYECKNTTYDSYVEYSKQYHRLVDLMELMTAYGEFKDKLEKVKHNIDYDMKH